MIRIWPFTRKSKAQRHAERAGRLMAEGIRQAQERAAPMPRQLPPGRS